MREVTARAPRATIGIILQAIGFLLVWSVRVPRPAPMWTGGSWANILLATASTLLAAGSFTLIFVAIRHLGPQWAVQARTIKGHALVTTGPYGIVRHPIYLGLGGFLVAVGLALATWWALVAGAAFYLIGANIRIKAEDALMVATFGEAFEAYRRRVPALVPRIRAV
jgi:protein-S-isoprenylcysteine O-methyltransferase Ste14